MSPHQSKAVVSRGEVYARIQAACDARDQGLVIFILALTDALILGWDEAIARAKGFVRIGDDSVFIEALPDKEAMRKAVKSELPYLLALLRVGKPRTFLQKTWVSWASVQWRTPDL